MKRNTPGLPKTHDLASKLKVPRYAAVGILEMLWHHAGRFTPRGDIGSLPDTAIAEAVCWPEKKALALINALIESRWLDPADESYRFRIHDWPEHCEYDVFRKVAELGGFLPEYGPVSRRENPRKNRDSSGNDPGKHPPSREAEAKALASDAVPGGGAGGTEMHWSVDESYQPFIAAYREARPNTLDEELAEAIWLWRKLAMDQRLKAVRGIVQRVQNGIWRPAEPHFVMPPAKYLQVEWKRDVAPQQGNGPQLGKKAAGALKLLQSREVSDDKRD